MSETTEPVAGLEARYAALRQAARSEGGDPGDVLDGHRLTAPDHEGDASDAHNATTPGEGNNSLVRARAQGLGNECAAVAV